MALNQTLNQFNPMKVGTCLNSIASANRIKTKAYEPSSNGIQ